MQFNDKLVFLMNITQTSNKELAHGISVDPSLISLLRTGKRKQPKNTAHIQHMASFFAKKCSADFQRNALAEMLGQSSICATMPTEILEKRLESWLLKDSGIFDHLIDGMESVSEIPQSFTQREEKAHANTASTFFFGEKGRREVMRNSMRILRETKTPGPIYVFSDDNLEWLLSDYMFSKEIQTDMLEIINRGFTFYQIMPAINFLPRYAESLQFWLPMYSTGRVKVYYFPRLRDNLFRRAMVVVPKRSAQISNAIGLGSSSDITIFSTDPQVVDTYASQFNELLSMCRPALSVYPDSKDFFVNFQDLFTRQGDLIQMVDPLSITTMPKELLEDCVARTTTPIWRSTFQMYLDELPHFEQSLNNHIHIDMARLATADEIRSGKSCIASAVSTYPGQLYYTPETYILHLENILRLMDEYEKYYFVPYSDTGWGDYNLFANMDGLALLVRTSFPPLMLEITRPEMVMACREYLLRKAERVGYDGIQRTKNRLKIKELIKELKN